MPKIPRDMSSTDLIRFVKRYEYNVKKQTGSHIRLSSRFMGYEHSITIPNHDPIKIGTLNKILNDISYYVKIQKNKLFDENL